MEYVALKDVCKINMGQSPDSSSYNDNQEGIPFFQGNADFGDKYPVTRVWCNDPTKIAQAEDILIKARFVEMFGDPIQNPKGWNLPLIEDVVADEKNALKAGDVLISLVGTYGKLLIIPEDFEPGIINPRLMKITFDKEKVNPYYFKFFFQSESLKRALSENTHGGTMDILNLGIVRKIAMPLPPLELQNEFVSFVKQVDKSKVVVKKALEETQLLFNSLMQEYFG